MSFFFRVDQSTNMAALDLASNCRDNFDLTSATVVRIWRTLTGSKYSAYSTKGVCDNWYNNSLVNPVPIPDWYRPYFKLCNLYSKWQNGTFYSPPVPTTQVSYWHRVSSVCPLLSVGVRKLVIFSTASLILRKLGRMKNSWSLFFRTDPTIVWSRAGQ